jgi:hypothetical protein
LVKLLQNLALVLVTLVVGIGLAELALRAMGVSYAHFYRPDAVLGQVLVPGAEGWDRTENDMFIRINSLGMRDRERDVAKPDGTFRIAVLGDSFTEAKQVELDETFAAVIERQLAFCPARGERQIEVLNFGVAGYSTTQQLLMFEHRARHFAPDLVVLATLTGNDIRNNSLELQGDSKPHFVEVDGELVLDRSFAASLGSRIRTSPLGRWYYELVPYSRVLQLVQEAMLASKRRGQIERRAEELAQADERAVEGFELGLDDQIYLPPSEPAWRTAWHITEQVLLRLDRLVEAADARLLLVVLSNSIQVHPDEAVRQRFKTAIGADDLFYPDRRLGAFAAANGIDHLLLAPKLAEEAQRTGQCLHGFLQSVPCGGHWNAQGHARAGEIIAERICQEVLPEQRAGLKGTSYP